MASISIWLEATRPKTLPAAATPVFIGTALAHQDMVFDWRPAVLCLVFALLVQVGTNFANDYLDGVKGSDTKDRLGPRRAVASGLIPASLMKRVAIGILVLAFCLGLGLVAFGGWALILIGLASVVCAWLYTGGPYPLAYNGLGDLFVVLFFGLIAVSFTYYVQAGAFSLDSLTMGFACGLLVNNLLVINNLRDVEEDRASRKRTLVVILGRRFALRQYFFAVVFVWIAVLLMIPRFGWDTLVSWIPLVLAVKVALSLPQASGADDFLLALRCSGIVVALYGALLSVSIAF